MVLTCYRILPLFLLCLLTPSTLLLYNVPATDCFMLILVYHMKETGWVKISQDDTMKLHYQYQDEKAEDKS